MKFDRRIMMKRIREHIECPFCGAHPGQPCFTKSDYPLTGAYHMARIHAFTSEVRSIDGE